MFWNYRSLISFWPQKRPENALNVSNPSYFGRVILALMTSREPLDIDALRRSLPHYARIDYAPTMGSTNTELVAAAGVGAPAWTATLTDYQTAGHGRGGRAWTAPENSQLILSVLIRPGADAIDNLGTMPLVTGLAIIDALKELGYDAVLKWPNDVLLDGRKLCGILAEAVSLGHEPAFVIGLGLNISLTEEELPVPHAISLALADPSRADTLNRTDIAACVLGALHTRLSAWARGDIQPLLRDYRQACATIGADVRVLLPGDTSLSGTVTDIADSGQLLVKDPRGVIHELSAGDVEHVRLRNGSYS